MSAQTRDYHRRHDAVKRMWGPAADYMCVVGVDHPAREWAQKDGTDGTDPARHYQPMCAKHHHEYDGKWSAEERAKLSATNKALGRVPPSALGRKRSPEWHAKRNTPEARANMAAGQQRRRARERGEAQ